MSDGLTDADIPKRIGHIRHVPVGQWFKNWRVHEELSKAHVHPPWEDGIYVGDDRPGDKGPTKRVVLANRPEYPNEDYGERFTYIGMGGRDGEDGDELDDKTGKEKKKNKTHGGPQTSDQTFEHRSNAALVVAADRLTHVRVTQGAGASKYAPTKGYRYDGLYYVENPRCEIGPTGQFLVCKFDFVRVDSVGLNGTLPTDNGIDAERQP